MEERRHDGGRGDAVLLDELEERLGLELVHQDRGAAEERGEREEAERGRVVERARDEVHVVAAHRRLADELHRGVHRVLRELAHGALGLARRARGVDDDRRVLLDVGLLRPDGGARLGEQVPLVAAAARDLGADGDEVAIRDVREAFLRLLDHVPEVGLEADGLRAAVLRQVHELRGRRPPRYAHRRGPEARRAALHFEELGAVAHHDDDAGVPFEAAALEAHGHAVHPVVELPVGDAAIAPEDGRLLRLVGAVEGEDDRRVPRLPRQCPAREEETLGRELEEEPTLAGDPREGARAVRDLREIACCGLGCGTESLEARGEVRDRKEHGLGSPHCTVSSRVRVIWSVG